MLMALKHWIYYFFALPLLAVTPLRVRKLVVLKIILPFNLKFDTKARREHLAANLKKVYPQHSSLGWLVEQNIIFEIFLDAATWKFLFSFPSQRRSLLQIKGREHLDKALKQGQGALLLIGHIGSFVFSFYGLGVHRITYSILANDAPADRNFSLAYRLFARINLAIIKKQCRGSLISFPVGGSKTSASAAARRLARVLKSNEPVVAALDVPPAFSSSNSEVEFMDHDCVLPTGFLRVAKKAGSPVVIFHALWEGPFSHRCTLRFEEPFPLEGNIEEDLQKCASEIERIIQSDPPQWFHWQAFDRFIRE